MRLDKPVGALFADEELLEIIAAVLEAGKCRRRCASAHGHSTGGLANGSGTNPHPASGQSSLTTDPADANTMHDLFGVDFDLTGLLPPDRETGLTSLARLT